MTAVQELVDDPRAFLRHYLLQLDPLLNEPDPGALAGDGTMTMTLRDDSDGYVITRVRHRKGIAKLLNKINGTEQSKATRFYRVTRGAQGAADTFQAYVCPYRQDTQLPPKVLSGAANLMFTAEMTGCSFGIGIPNPQGHVSVVHANRSDLATRDSTAPQAAAQLAQMQSQLGAGHALQPHHYRVVDEGVDQRATTVGIRRKGRWEFWYQKYNFDAGTNHVISVTRIC